jgi:hypothetical protein
MSQNSNKYKPIIKQSNRYKSNDNRKEQKFMKTKNLTDTHIYKKKYNNNNNTEKKKRKNKFKKKKR